MLENKEGRIIESNRHQFIHMNYVEKENILQGLMYEYPVSINQDKPIMIYVDSIGLPNCSMHSSCDSVVLAVIAREYLNFSIAYNIVRVIQRQLNLVINDDEKNKLLTKMNSYISKDFGELKSLDDLLLLFNSVMYRYYKEYLTYSRTGMFNITERNMPMMFLDIQEFVQDVKTMLHNDSHLAVVLDVKNNMCNYSYSAVNTLIFSRMNEDLAIKIVCGENDWKNYFTSNGTFIERVHDYDVEYVGSFQDNSVKKLLLENDTNK